MTLSRCRCLGVALSVSLNLGNRVATLIFSGLFVVAVVLQIRAMRFHPFLCWATIIATTTSSKAPIP